MFQALIGTVETTGHLVSLFDRMRVSSPHRYCRNRCVFRRDVFCGEFQALIGTVETWADYLLVECRHMFQALIGTVETRPSAVASTAEGTFQALIGTVETCASQLVGNQRVAFQALIGTVETVCSGPYTMQLSAVSSPHRYCRNPRGRASRGDWKGVSSPHRYCRNAYSRGWRTTSSSFQALIGTVETIEP